MLRNTTFNLPDDLIARSKAYAANHGTTMTALVRQYLEAITASQADMKPPSPLLDYSMGNLSRQEAVRQMNFRDYADLLVALGDAGLPLPSQPAHEQENQIAAFLKIWKQS